ncbi:MAG: hypothetical protein WCK96_12225 [Methylococcales bacterium]
MYYKLVHGKRYGPYQYSARSKHEWTTKDLARIAKHLKEQNKLDAGDILIAVAFAVGLGAVFCKASKAITSGLSIMAFIEKVGAVLAMGQAIKVLIEFLLQIKLASPLWLKITLALLIALLIFIEKLLQAFNSFVADRQILMDGAEAVNSLCDKAKKYSGLAVEKTCDAISVDACYWAAREAEIIANELHPVFSSANTLTASGLVNMFVQIVQDNLHDGGFDNWTN